MTPWPNALGAILLIAIVALISLAPGWILRRRHQKVIFKRSVEGDKLIEEIDTFVVQILEYVEDKLSNSDDKPFEQTIFLPTDALVGKKEGGSEGLVDVWLKVHVSHLSYCLTVKTREGLNDEHLHYAQQYYQRLKVKCKSPQDVFLRNDQLQPLISPIILFPSPKIQAA